MFPSPTLLNEPEEVLKVNVFPFPVAVSFNSPFVSLAVYVVPPSVNESGVVALSVTSSFVPSSFR